MPEVDCTDPLTVYRTLTYSMSWSDLLAALWQKCINKIMNHLDLDNMYYILYYFEKEKKRKVKKKKKKKNYFIVKYFRVTVTFLQIVAVSAILLSPLQRRTDSVGHQHAVSTRCSGPCPHPSSTGWICKHL